MVAPTDWPERFDAPATPETAEQAHARGFREGLERAAKLMREYDTSLDDLARSLADEVP